MFAAASHYVVNEILAEVLLEIVISEFGFALFQERLLSSFQTSGLVVFIYGEIFCHIVFKAVGADLFSY